MPESIDSKALFLKELRNNIGGARNFKSFLMLISDFTIYLQSVAEFRSALKNKHSQLRKTEDEFKASEKKIRKEFIALQKKHGFWGAPEGSGIPIIKIQQLFPACPSYHSFLAAKDKFEKLNRKSVWNAWEKLLSIRKYLDGKTESIRPGNFSDLIKIEEAEQSLLTKKEVEQVRKRYLGLVDIVGNFCLTAAHSKKARRESREVTLRLEFDTKTRKININDIRISRPDFDSINHSIFEYLYEHPGKKFTKSDLESALKITIRKSLLAFLDNLNFHNTIRNLFFSATRNKICMNAREVCVTDAKERSLVREEIRLIKAKNKKSSAKKINRHK